MFIKGQKVYADTYKYLRHKTKNIIALSFIGEKDDFEEVAMTRPIEFEIEGGKVFWEDRKLAFIVDSLDYVTIKTSIIKSRYSNDDQIALMLNKDNSEDDAMLYDKMQEWREWASWVGKEVSSING